jgi:2-polyprenyl-6-hydroxyphenyl methylase/3-demethylubiquinone-9 3-methyltransferase
MSTIRNDLGLYERHACEWWNEGHNFARSLREVNRLCLEAIVTGIGDRLDGMTVVDLGCGGGLLAEPLAGMGARVLANDISLGSLRAARRHAREGGVDGLAVVHGDALRPPYADGCADVVLCADILEHIHDWRLVLHGAAALLRPGGRIFASTLNRTWQARWLGVHLAEGLGYVPKGTHDPEMFITPQELADQGLALGLRPGSAIGFAPRLWRTVMSRRLHMGPSASVAVEYAMWLEKPG